jgi:protocatechuate 3,4-dioxygenase, beta subunit
MLQEGHVTTVLRPRDFSSHPAYLDPHYRSTSLRGPTKPLIRVSGVSLSAPVFGHDHLGAHDADLTVNGKKDADPLGERIVVTGRVLDEDGRPVPNTLVEIWQANAAGRYIHVVDQHAAPLDPNFFGGGRTITNTEGRYRFLTIKPGAYPWGNHVNAWRPNHIHFSLFGHHLGQRLVTQSTFPATRCWSWTLSTKASPKKRGRVWLRASRLMKRRKVSRSATSLTSFCEDHPRPSGTITDEQRKAFGPDALANRWSLLRLRAGA